MHEPAICALAHANKDAVDAAWQAVKEAQHPRIHVFLSSSEIHIAHQLKKGFVPIRKPGKLPADKLSVEYSLEYGTDRIEMHKDAIQKGARVLLVDDLLATGGTMKAACELVEKAGGAVVECAFIIHLASLQGEKVIDEYGMLAMIRYD